jgi:hypothetical protein
VDVMALLGRPALVTDGMSLGDLLSRLGSTI